MANAYAQPVALRKYCGCTCDDREIQPKLSLATKWATTIETAGDASVIYQSVPTLCPHLRENTADRRDRTGSTKPSDARNYGPFQRFVVRRKRPVPVRLPPHLYSESS